MLFCIVVLTCYRLDLKFVDLFLMHSVIGGKVLETWDTMVELKKRGLTK